MKNRIRELRKEKGMTQKQLGAVLGVAESTISQYETGKRQPSHETMLRFGEIFGESYEYILGQGADISPARLPDKTRKIPILGSVPAGVPVEAVENIVGWEKIDSELSGDYFALHVDGDSMYPEYLPGDIIIVKVQTTCESGDDCIVYVNGYNATLKRVRLDENGNLTIQPINPNYPPRTYSRKDVETLPVSIAGVVVELRRRKK